MLWELMANGHLRTYAGYVPFVACFLILVIGPVFIRLLWPWKSKVARHEDKEDPGGGSPGVRPEARVDRADD